MLFVGFRTSLVNFFSYFAWISSVRIQYMFCQVYSSRCVLKLALLYGATHVAAGQQPQHIASSRLSDF